MNESLDREIARGLSLLEGRERVDLANLVGSDLAAARAEAWALRYRPGWLQLLESSGQSRESHERKHLQRIAAAAAGLAELLRSDVVTLGGLYGIRGVFNTDPSVDKRPYMLTSAPNVLLELDRLSLRAREVAAMTKGKPGKRTAAPDFVHAVDSISYFVEYCGVPFSSADNAKMTRACRLLLGALGYPGDVREVLRQLGRRKAKMRLAFSSGRGGDIQPAADADNAP